MSILGIGPILAVVGVASAGSVIVLERMTGWSVPAPSPWRGGVLWVGVVFILIGVYFWLSSAVLVKRAFGDQKLVTRGVYHLSRNPMYAGFILFIVPGIAFVLNDLLLVVISVCMFVAFRLRVGQEEALLAKQFGAEFEEYRKAVPQLVPFVRR